MFNLLVCSPLLILLPFWRDFNTRSVYLLCILIVLFLSLMYTGFYLNGEDWANYYTNFFTSNGSSWFEPGFYIFFKGLSVITFGNFGITIVLFYFTAFFMIINILNKIGKVNIPLFLILFIICFGNTLILEQLRQLYSVIFGLYALHYYSNKTKERECKYLFYLFLALSFHSSAIILFFSFYISRIKNLFVFSTITLICTGLIIILLIFPSLISPLFILFPQLALKLNQYLDLTKVGFHIGPSVFFFIISLSYFIFNIRKISPIFNAEWFIYRQLFIGVLIFSIGLYVPFASRFSVFYLIFAFVFTSAINYTTNNMMTFVKSKCTWALFMVLFITSNNFSYYRNSIAPIAFNQLTTHLFSFLSDNVNYAELVSNIYQKNYDNLNEYRDAQGK